MNSASFFYKFFLTVTVLSFIYSLFGEYNGDYLGVPVTLNFTLLFINLILAILPYFLFWRLYLNQKKNAKATVKYVSRNLIFCLILILFIYNLFAIIIYGVGVAEAPVYTAPFYIKPLIQILNRISFGYFIFYFILINDSFILNFISVLMLITLNYLSHGLGSIFFLGFIYIIKYQDRLVYIIKKNYIILIFLLLTTPFLLTVLFSVRDQLRGNESKELTLNEFFFGRFVGRLSSFSNSAIILQEPGYFLLVSNTELDRFYYQIQIFKGLFGGDYREKKPELYMKGVYDTVVDPNSAFMTSTQGNAMISFLRSPLNMLLNLFTLFIMVYLIFRLSFFLNFKNCHEYAFLLAIYPITSGVPTEFITIITTFVFIIFTNYIFLKIQNNINKK